MRRRERGAALVEFAITALVLYLLVAGGLELGRMVFVSQVLQDAARVAARELAVTPLVAGISFDDALTDPLVQAGIWDPDRLVVDLDVHEADLDGYFAGMPLVNQALRPVFIAENVTIAGAPRRFLRYPGALLAKAGTETGFTVGVPRVTARGADGVETIDWVPVLEEVRATGLDPDCGPFNQVPPLTCIPAPAVSGVAAVRINYPFQAAALSGYRSAGLDGNGNPNPNVGFVISANDAGVTDLAGPPGGATLNPGSADPFGLGAQLALGQTVRPFRRLLSGQSMFRREVFQ